MSAPAVWNLVVGRAGFPGYQAGSLGSFGIETPMCTFRSMDDDEFTFDIKQPATSDPTFAWGLPVALYKVAAGVTTCWFIGTITKQTIVASGETETVKYVCSGPWWQLKRTLWQPLCNAYNPLTCALFPIPLSKVVLFQDPTTGAPISTGQQINNVIAYARTVGIAAAIGTIPSFVTPPLEETRDILLSDAIRRCMQWTPDGVTWFNYSSGAAVFNAANRALLAGVTLNLGLTNLVTEINLVERNDLVPVGVLFNYIGIAFCNVPVPNGCADPSTGIVNTSGISKLSQSPVQVQTVTQDTVGIPTLPGGIIGSIDLTQLTPTTTEPAPTGLAAAYFLSLITPTWDGSVTTHEQDCSGILRPGLVLNLSNGDASWATMNAQIQEVREDLYRGETVCSVGTPGHLAPQNFATLIQMTRRRALVPSSGLAAVNTPGSLNGTACQQGVDPKVQKIVNGIGGNPQTTVAALNKGFSGVLGTCGISVCEGGTLSNITVYCPSS